MTRKPLALSAEAPLRDALAALLAHGVHSAPVVDSRGRVLGLLSQTDLLPLAAGNASSATADLARLQYVCGEPRDAPPLSLRPRACTARDALPAARQLVAVPPNAPLPEAAALMLHHGLHTLPVIAPHRGDGEESEEEEEEEEEQHWRSRGASAEQAAAAAAAACCAPPRLLGVVSRADILRAVLEAAQREEGGGGEGISSGMSGGGSGGGVTLTPVPRPAPPSPLPPLLPPRRRGATWRVQRLEQRSAAAPRFYEQRVQRSAGGAGGSFVRTARWGRVGSAADTPAAAGGAGGAPGRPPRVSDYHASFEAASAAVDAVAAAKLRHQGYVIATDEDDAFAEREDEGGDDCRAAALYL
jgi:CBS domain-containing protein